jgi:hypothetical protein
VVQHVVVLLPRFAAAAYVCGIEKGVKAMEHKAGDTVRIQPQEWWSERTDMTGIFRDHGLKYAGRTAKIMERDDAIYSLDIDGGDWRWEEEMFDPDYRPEDEPLSAEDAIHAMMDDGETLYDGEGNPHSFYKERSRFELTDLGDRHNGVVAVFGDLYRHPPKRARRWTRWEILAWAGSEESRGWVVRHDGDTAW